MLFKALSTSVFDFCVDPPEVANLRKKIKSSIALGGTFQIYRFEPKHTGSFSVFVCFFMCLPGSENS